MSYRAHLIAWVLIALVVGAGRVVFAAGDGVIDATEQALKEADKELEPVKRALDLGQPAYAPGELLVKLTPAASAELTAALDAGRYPGVLGIFWLDELSVQYDVEKIEPLFRAYDPDATRQRYPQRARRAPKDAVAPQMDTIYKFMLKSDTDVPSAAAAYKQRPEVIYAEPNYLATIQGDPRRAPTLQ